MNTSEKLTAIAENVPKVYKAGKQTVYDIFWDTFQQNGNRTDYRYGFAGPGWTAEIFKPKYDIRLKDSYLNHIFNESLLGIDLADVLERNGIKLDFSGVTNASNLFYWCLTTHIPEVGADTVTKANSIFGVAWMLVTIEKLTVHPDCDMTNAFFRCDALENITLENEINSGTWKFAGVHKLSRKSITHIIGKLSATSTGLSITFSYNSITKAFGSVESAEWQALVSSKPNWTISLI